MTGSWAASMKALGEKHDFITNSATRSEEPFPVLGRLAGLNRRAELFISNLSVCLIHLLSVCLV